MQTLSPPARNGASTRPSAMLPRSRRRRVPLAIGAALAAVMCALLFALLYRSAGQRQLALVVVRDVPAGRVVMAGDLAARQVSLGPSVSFVAFDRRGDVIGRPAAVDLVAGTVLSPREIGRARGIDPSEAVVSLSLPDGETPSVAPGDEVQLVRTATQSRSDGTDDGVLIATAQVVEVRRDASGKVAVSVAVDRGIAAEVAGASAANRVRVVRISGS